MDRGRTGRQWARNQTGESPFVLRRLLILVRKFLASLDLSLRLLLKSEIAIDKEWVRPISFAALLRSAAHSTARHCRQGILRWLLDVDLSLRQAFALSTHVCRLLDSR